MPAHLLLQYCLGFVVRTNNSNNRRVPETGTNSAYNLEFSVRGHVVFGDPPQTLGYTFHIPYIITINEITIETSQNISSVINGINKRYSKTVDHLGYHDLSKLRKDTKKLNNLEDEVDELKDNVFYFIKSLEDNSVGASKFYILFLDILQDMVQSIGQITRSSYRHVNNNHKNLKFNQIRDLKSIDREMQVLFDEIIETFDNHSFSRIDQILNDKQALVDKVSGLIQKQIERIRTSETSPKNTKLYFGLLLETKDLVTSTMSLLQLFKEYYEDAKREF